MRLKELVIAGVLAASTLLSVNAAARPLTAEEKATVATAVTHDLKDPASAQFRWGDKVTPGPDGAYCAEVNAKNSFGAYVGFTPFVVFLGHDKGRVVAVLIGSLDGESSASAARKVCKDQGYALN